MTLFIKPEWPAPSHVKAFTTLRTCGNLAKHVGDDEQEVQRNRDKMQRELQLTNEPIWTEQTHSTLVIPATPENRYKNADASYTHQLHHTCVILTADCLPLLFCNRAGTHVAATHAGWRGLAGGIIKNTINALSLPPDELLVWLGPGISQKNYEVGDEVRDQFLEHHPDATEAFIPSPQGRWLADLYALARLQLKKLGIQAIFGGEHCTFGDADLFYSYRREGKQAGRFATLIWLERPFQG